MTRINWNSRTLDGRGDGTSSATDGVRDADDLGGRHQQCHIAMDAGCRAVLLCARKQGTQRAPSHQRTRVTAGQSPRTLRTTCLIDSVSPQRGSNNHPPCISRWMHPVREHAGASVPLVHEPAGQGAWAAL